MHVIKYALVVGKASFSSLYWRIFSLFAERNNNPMRYSKFSFFLPLLVCHLLKAQAPSPALVGYFHNWNTQQTPYIQLDEIDTRYNVVDISFAIPQAGTTFNMEFVPEVVSQAIFISQIQTLQSQGRKVIISMGGANAPVSLNNTAEKDVFVSSMLGIIATYGFDGIDVDFEGSSVSVSGGTITNPVDAPVINLITGIREIMNNYYEQNNHRLLLTMAPETVFIQGGQSAYAGSWGGYLPIVNALRDSIEILHVQLYNTGSMYGIDGNIYESGTADFIVAMTEATIQGFTTAGGLFEGLPASKIAIGLPACEAAAGGFTAPLTVKAAVDYLRGEGPQPGSYILEQSAGYPDLRGLMTWSINWDAINTCGPAGGFADNYELIFGTSTAMNDKPVVNNVVWPNPAATTISVSYKNAINKNVLVKDITGKIVFAGIMKEEEMEIDISEFQCGVYFVGFDNQFTRIIKQ